MSPSAPASSISTVSNALNRPRLGERAARRRACARPPTQLGYVPLHAAQQLRAGRSGLLGMTVINIANPFFADLVSGAEEAAAAAGYACWSATASDDVARSAATSSCSSACRSRASSCALRRRRGWHRATARPRHPRRARRRRRRHGRAALGVVRRRRRADGSPPSTCSRPAAAGWRSWAHAKRCARCASDCRARGSPWPAHPDASLDVDLVGAHHLRARQGARRRDRRGRARDCAPTASSPSNDHLAMRRGLRSHQQRRAGARTRSP